ncbi:MULTISPECIES: hypothetical protein [unclassified Caballeronia]|uniref:hypothetical protein n=1 Tax=unclassified Caballeronia TaxID=2646786 RepID=UPI0028649B9B|nr:MULTISPECIES: hypothetical protein [unclassified Caballeronia]MDR5754940.1 hypothetical protein [Caballeronia sp. LZ024]MDR5845499.1 hypothetical protein [Caballeronia sp. LZ031]
MKKISNWFCAGPSAQYGNNVAGILRCLLLAIAAIAAAMVHRWLGYEFPHQGLRALEAGLCSALPSTLEHALAAFGTLSLLVLPVCWTQSTTRCRMFACFIGAVAYFALTTMGWDYLQYRATHDAAQLAQMAGDVAGLLCAVHWLTRAQPVRLHQRLA